LHYAHGVADEVGNTQQEVGSGTGDGQGLRTCSYRNVAGREGFVSVVQQDRNGAILVVCDRQISVAVIVEVANANGFRVVPDTNRSAQRSQHSGAIAEKDASLTVLFSVFATAMSRFPSRLKSPAVNEVGVFTDEPTA